MLKVGLFVCDFVGCSTSYNHRHEVWDKWEIPGNFIKTTSDWKEFF